MSGSITIRYYSNTTSIIFQEDQGKKLENILLEKIASNQRSSEARLAANDDESVEEDPYSDQIKSLTVQTTADPNLNSDKTCTVNLSYLNDKTVEEDPYSDLNESLIVTCNSSQTNGDEPNGVPTKKRQLSSFMFMSTAS